jgi:hypothetical protein
MNEPKEEKNYPKTLFVLVDMSRMGLILKMDGFIPCGEYMYHGLAQFSNYEFGAFKTGNDDIRVILFTGDSIPMASFCSLWNQIYPKKVED